MMHRLTLRLRQHSRRKRYEVICRLLRVEEARGVVLDLGGGAASFFASLFPRPDCLVLVDIDPQLARRAKEKRPAAHVVVADGGRLPFADGSVHITVCNSVIEHVEDPGLLAGEVRRISKGYFLQTPSGSFPLETHSFVAVPFYNGIPWKALRRLVCKLFGANYAYVSSVRYLSEQQLRSLFPEATVAYERAAGLTKSFYLYHPCQAACT